jgi:hypothetical protein
MEMIIPIIAAVVGLAVGAGGIFAYNKHNENGGKDKAEDLVRKAKREASDIVLNAKKEDRLKVINSLALWKFKQD